MNTKISLRSLLLLPLLLQAGCGDEFQPLATDGDGGPFEGVMWRLEAIRSSAENRIEKVAPEANVTITFEDSLAGGIGGCNRYGARYTAGDDTMSIDVVFSTFVNCEQYDRLEGRYFEALEKVHSYTADQTTLHLYYEGGNVLDFVKIPTPKRTRIIFNSAITPGTAPSPYVLETATDDGEPRGTVAAGALLAHPPMRGKIAYTGNDQGGRLAVFISKIEGIGPEVVYAAVPEPVPGTAAISPSGGKIAFGVDAGNTPQQALMVSDADGGNLRTISSEMMRGAIPAFSPDGRLVAFHSHDARILVADVEGNTPPIAVAANAIGVRGYLHGYERLEWSPDGSRIAYIGTVGYFATDIFLAPLDGSTPINLTGDEEGDMWPTWSPDGAWLALTGGNRVCRIRADGTGGKDYIVAPKYVEELYPQWSPDGGKIMLVGFTKAAQTSDPIPGRLITVDLDTRRETTIAEEAYKGFWIR